MIAFNGEGHHVHILLELPANFDLSRFVANLKTASRLILPD
ncbi:MAG: transposase [Hyphomicrobiaceae bacterium]|nr:transposase [Hyphomicrobiaceae bacterium]